MGSPISAVTRSAIQVPRPTTRPWASGPGTVTTAKIPAPMATYSQESRVSSAGPASRSAAQAALSAYERMRSTLAQELDIAPAPASQRLAAAILSQNPALDRERTWRY